jgi:Polysaccharide lyase family 8, C-terminal beta-sandwich domain./Polysaccharide lyase family 8, super-sandwich domain./Lyase, N terminal./Lyase, catalytic.
MKKILISILSMAFTISLNASDYRFEDKVPNTFSVVKGSDLSLSDIYFKDGKKSLKWTWISSSPLSVSDLTLNKAASSSKGGITLWIYNEKPIADMLQFTFETAKGDKTYSFNFNLSYKGWRACWVKFSDMNKNDLVSGNIIKMLIYPPKSIAKGSVFLDRMSISSKPLSDRITPDMQLQDNNKIQNRDLWHWCRLWEWEQYKYDLSLPLSVSNEETTSLIEIGKRITNAVFPKKANRSLIDKGMKIFAEAGIIKIGDHVLGKPLVSNDELNRDSGDLSLTDVNDMMIAFAQDWVINKSKESLKHYFEVFDYSIEQGMAFGSGMGTNHHYGYQIRDVFTSAWIMKNEILNSKNADDYHKVLCYWSGLQESRIPYQYGRDELLDTWHTLLMPKLICAMMFEDEKERCRAMHALSRWISGSMAFTPGTIGGIKVDGTTFHHGGFYPAYSVGAFAALGNYLMVTNNTPFEISKESRMNLKLALQSMRNYTNLTDWGIGICGRHPFSGNIPDEDVNAFAYLALAGDLTENGNAFDKELASDFLRFGIGNNSIVKSFSKKGVLEAQSPQGFWEYNYGALGIHRRKNWMVILKGYNTDVWNSEIYAKDNRFGRYQSYGSVQIIGSGNPVSQKESGFVENGWDWNRLPGTTTIHLPFDLLESPFKGTEMEHSPEHFAGASSFKGKNGVFAIKLLERDIPNFTPGFSARKSAFCFDNRIICLGSGISNNNEKYPTETTLFQVALKDKNESISINNNEIYDFPFSKEYNTLNSFVCRDTKGNYYFVKNSGNVKVLRQHQYSLENRNKKHTEGDFVSAYIMHGKAPANQGYEYMILIQPENKELKEISGESYSVLSKDNRLHAVYDRKTNITGYVFFEEYKANDNSSEILECEKELLVMSQPEDQNKKTMSVCMPDLNISQKTYTTREPSKAVVQTIMIRGNWKIASEKDNVTVIPSPNENHTILKINCVDGRSVEFTLTKY